MHENRLIVVLFPMMFSIKTLFLSKSVWRKKKHFQEILVYWSRYDFFLFVDKIEKKLPEILLLVMQKMGSIRWTNTEKSRLRFVRNFWDTLYLLYHVKCRSLVKNQLDIARKTQFYGFPR